MENILTFNNISEYNSFNKQETLHPLVSIVDLSNADPRQSRRMSYNFYTVFLKQLVCGDLRYGLNNYDYQEGTLIFLAPGQVIGENIPEQYYQPQGLALVFHQDLIHGSNLGRHMGDYNFFSYEVREALHISEQEKQIVLDCFSKITFELKHSIDKHSKKLVAANIELFLDYCIRFYDRQFITRDNVHRGFVEKFEALLNDYFASDKPQNDGLPNVAYCADKLNLSTNYFGDVIKKETGKTALEFIQMKIMDVAKEKMFEPDKTVNEIAYELGFKYPQHFSRLFKQRVGFTPNEYRNLN
ncbi:helix-turn-helix domain-containing protein [Mucilaginibacter sp. SP1R1]|uniref:helix-turn-helix domain-containing protein n=1 Tax=Mucilaginibacter sp. SP1R1 TaxID=2723091 RepID=UPI00162025EB|nr:helix-turn-helix domain-containing protein [Mucilaginibacter sp. SP1R1]MBB6149969.1 AraC-like DNA-binding protein [Mucilaginibacter sp. SP1R1]